MSYKETRIAFLRVAVIHDALLYMGGAERVFSAILRLYPTADVYTAFLVPELRGWVSRYTSGNVFVSPFDRIPYIRRFADWFKPAILFWWESLDLSSYDLIISSSHSFSAKSVIVPDGVTHVSYVHTPPRYMYNEYNESRWTRHPLVKFLLKPVFFWMKKKDYIAAQRPDVIIANSKTVQQRIKRYYSRDSVVIYPPIYVPPKAVLRDRKPTYFLCVSRLVKQKGIDLAIRACDELKLPLVIVGTGPQEAYLRSIAGPTVIFLGFVSDDKMAEAYRKARALLYCSRDEDFGMAPVEAMAHGVPVIGYSSGGVRETVADGKTGTLFSRYSASYLEQSIKIFLMRSWSAEACRRQATRFSERRFANEFIKIVSRVLNQKEKL
ncbi:glycosyltransferase [Candidatus Gottesmanbacteria bacterium]|nr:glycosyltransferase [Candidatus Gottesmanbacteria bacterium]